MITASGAAVAVLVVVLFGVALTAMTNGAFRIAGFCFLSASLVIYLRERYLVDS